MAITTEDFSGKTPDVDAHAAGDWDNVSIVASNWNVDLFYRSLSGSYSGVVLEITSRFPSAPDRNHAKLLWLEAGSLGVTTGWSVLALVRFPGAETDNAGPGLGVGNLRDGFDSCWGSLLTRDRYNGAGPMLTVVGSAASGSAFQTADANAQAAVTPGLGERWFVRCARTAAGNALVRAWKVGEEEPGTWQIDDDATGVSGPIAGPPGILMEMSADDADDAEAGVAYVEYIASTPDYVTDGHPVAPEVGGGGGIGHPRPLASLTFLKDAFSSFLKQWS